MGKNRQNKLLIKRSNVPGKKPNPGDLLLGELALNTADVKLYTSGTTEDDIIQIGWDRVNRTGDTMTGQLNAPSISANTYFGDGSNLTGIEDLYTTAATFDSATNIISFDRVDSLSAYTLDLGLLDAEVTEIIWAEETLALSNNNIQFSFGNGGVGGGLYTVYDGNIKKVFLQAQIEGTSVSIDILLDGSVAGTASFTSSGVFEFPVEVAFVEGQLITFRTNTVVGTYINTRVGAGLIQTVKGLKGPKGDDGGSTDQAGLNYISDFTSISSSGQNFASTTNGVLLANDGLGGTTRPKPTGIFSYDSTNFWFDVSNLFNTGAVACSVQFRVKLVPLAGNGFFDVEVVAYGDRNNIPGSQLFSNSNGLVRAQQTTGLPANPSPIFNILASENVDVLRVFTYSQNNTEQVELNLFQVDYKLYF